MNNRVMAAIAVLALAGCDRASEAPPEPVVTAEARAEPASIIREDIEVEREAPPLAPLTARIGFPEGGIALSQAALAQLAKVLQSPQMTAGGGITLRGHSDSAGSDAANLRASKTRAEAVRDWLVDHGVDEDRVTVIAMGEQNPVEPNALPDGSANEAGRSANRRVEIDIAVPSGTPAAQQTGASETLVDELTRPSD